MFALHDIQNGHFAALWQYFQAPLLGGLLALVLLLLGRWWRWPLLGTAAPALGVLLAWFLLSRTMAPAPTLPAWRLLPIALAGALLCPLAARWLPRQGALICLVLLAAGGGWWLAGAPRHWPTWVALVPLLCLVLALFLGARLLLRDGPRWLILAALSLSGALWVVQAPPIWLLLALAPALAGLVIMLAPVAGALLLLPVVMDLLAVAAATMLAAGRLARPGGNVPGGNMFGINAVDLAVMAPFLAVLLVPRMRVRWAIAAPLAGGGAILLAWGARMWFSS